MYTIFIINSHGYTSGLAKGVKNPDMPLRNRHDTIVILLPKMS